MHHAPTRFSFLGKLAGMLALVVLSDTLFYGVQAGATLGGFALAWEAVLAMCRKDVRKRGRVALGVAAALGIVLIDDPSLLGWTLFWIALAVAALLPRHPFDDALQWARRLLLHAGLGLARPFLDAAGVLRAPRDATRTSPRAVAALLALPIAGGATFIALFAGANPLIGDAFSRIALPSPWRAIGHALLWLLTALAVWPSLRPHPYATRVSGDAIERVWPEVRLASILLSLVTFNLIFATQNALDVAFLWSGAALPGGVTMAGYAHRGAYALIVAALLAGVFVLAVLRPGTAGAHSPWARRLVVLWVAQTLLLVASSALRTIDYIAAYSLTILRVSALAWMALVATGLALICWRLIRGRSARWLINANALAATVVLPAASVVDVGAVAATWNVRHARELGDGAPPLDLCYLNRLGASALLPLGELEARVRTPILHDQIVYTLDSTLRATRLGQRDWRGWTARDARRLATAERALAGRRLALAPAPNGRACDGAILPPPPRIETVPPTTPLTAGAQR